MMSLRLVTSIIVTFIAITTTGAQEWQPFGVRHAGFVFDVPPEFALDQVAKDGTGPTFVYPKNATLTVWGDKLPGSEFEAKIKAQLNKDESAGWDISYRRIMPTWASYSGIKDDKIRYFRAIAICNDRVAVFQLDYDRANKVAYDPVVTRMVKSLKAEGC
jgi:hypothetical protein